MSLKKTRFRKGVIVAPDTDALEGIEGEIKVDSADKKIKTTLDSASREIVTNSQAQTLTNKTLTSPVLNGDLTGTAIDTDTSLSANSDTKVASQKAVKAYIDAGLASQNDASEIIVVPAGTIASTNVQDALEELDGDIQAHISDAVDAHDASAISIVDASGNFTSTEVEGALAESMDAAQAAQADATQALADAAAAQADIDNHIADISDAHDASAISNIPAGNLAATDVQGALNELQTDIDTRATSAALSAHTGASSGVHGVTGSVVGTTDSQTLTNKTITGASIQTPVRSDVKQDTKANLTTYAITATNGQLVFATDTKEMFQVVDGVLEAVGGSAGIGGVDILFVQDFEEAALTDFTQTGLSLSTSSPLHGEISALLTHQNAVNQSFKQVVAVDPKFRGQAINMRLNLKSNASAGNVTISVYDETNSASLLGSTQLNLSNDTAGIQNSVSFTIPSTCASISYTITALPEAGSPVTRIDDIIAELSTVALLETSVEVPVVTEWQSYTPTFQGFGTPTNIEFEWRQVGENVEIRGKFVSGTSTAVEARVGLPGGLTSAGTGLIPSIQTVGMLARGVNPSNPESVLIEPSVSYVTFGLYSSGSPLTKLNGSDIGSTNTVSFFASVPCAGLSATSTKTIPLTQSGLVQEADSELIASGNSGQSITIEVTDIPFTLTSLTGSDIQYDGNSFTVLTDGIYSISAIVQFTTSLVRSLSIYVNGTQTYRICSDTSSVPRLYGSGQFPFNAGDVVSLRAISNGGTLDSGTILNHRLVVTKQGSLKQVSVNTDSKITIPTSELRFEGASARGAVATAIVKFDTLAKIRGDAFTVTNTANDGTYVTMTKAGKLDVSASLIYAANTGILLTKNQTTLTTNPSVVTEILASQLGVGAGAGNLSWQGYVAVGDILRICSSGSSPSANTINQLNLSFQEQDISVSVTNTLPQFSESDSCVRVDTANGFGSTNTLVRRFSNISDNIGVDISYTDSATNGASFTVLEDGIYSISYSESITTASANMGIVKNQTTLTDTSSDLARERHSATAGEEIMNASWTGYLVQGDIIRPIATAAAFSNARVLFTISKVGKPNVTGVDVTPFVNVPQPVSQYLNLINSPGFGSTNTLVRRFTSTQFSQGNGLFSYEDSATLGASFTALKNCYVTFGYSEDGGITGQSRFHVVKNATTETNIINSSSVEPGASRHSVAGSVYLSAGDIIRPIVEVPARHITSSSIVRFSITATALSDQILTAPETFSTDTASLSYKSSSEYTLSTLENAPVGSYITFTYAANTNTRTQTTTRPTQTDADMNANGILLYTRAYNAASTAAQPAVVAIQIGKGLKGRSLDLYKSAGKTITGSLDSSNNTTSKMIGAYFKTYNEVTGILYVDAAYNNNTTFTSAVFGFEDATEQTSGYLVINASKNASLTGIGLNRIAARAVNTSGQSIATTATLVTWDSVKTIDTHGALNTSTGVFTAPETGYYWFDAQLTYSNDTYTANQQANVYVYKNGSQYAIGRVRAHAATTLSIMAGISDVVFLAKDDTLSVYGLNESGPTALYAGASDSHFSITKISV